MFKEKLSFYRETINKELEKILIKLENKDCSLVCEAMKYSLISGGKLLRPVLTLAVCEMFNENVEKAISFACAVEFIHVGSLVHDDLPCMDDDSLRRGKASCHVKFNEAIAVLVGDVFFSFAFEVLTYGKNYGLKDESILKAVVLLSKMFGTNGIVCGQEMDLFTRNDNKNLKIIEKIAFYKTSSLMRAAVGLGCIAAKVKNFELEKMNEFAKYFGIFFQICDDILDYEQKKIKGEKKIDFISIYGLKEAKELAGNYYNKALNVLKFFNNNKFLKNLTNYAFERIN